MRAIVVTEPGGPTVLQPADVPAPAPAVGEVRVRVRAFGLNRADLLQRRGLYPAPPGSPPDIPGLEYAGEVEALGAGVEGVRVGDRVMGIVGGGSYAELLVTAAVHTLPIPDGMSFEDAAAIPEVFMTAHDALDRLGVAKGEWVLVHAVGSGVGTAAVQLIRARAARSVGTSRTASKLERARAYGMDEGIETGSDDLVAAVRRITGGGAHAVIDLIGGDVFPRTLEAMAPRGRVLLVGLTAGGSARVDLRVLMTKRLRVEGTVLRSRPAEEKSVLARSFREEVLPLFGSGALRPIVDRVFAFEETPRAHEYLESNASFGKVVVTVADPSAASRWVPPRSR